MHTVLELIQLTTDYFTKKQIESPRLNAELLLAHVLGCKRLELYLMFDKPVKEAELAQYRAYIKDRGERKPLQYIIGETEFFGLSFKTNASALIPRPETELLVEKCISLLKEPAAPLRILDIGCGSGIIPICLAKQFPEAEITAIDISPEALALSAENAALHNVSNNIKFIALDAREISAGSLGTFNLVVSNPPYVSKDEFATLQDEIIKYEPAIAVTDSADGYFFYRLIIEKTEQLLDGGGWLCFEMGQGQADTISGLLQTANYSDIAIECDYQQIERVISGRKA